MSYKPLGIAELNALELPPVEYVIDGIIPAGALVLLSSREKSGKSLMVIDLLMSIATGESFLDREATPGPVVYLSLEDNLRDVRARTNTRLDGLRDVPFSVLPADGSLPDVRFNLQDSASLESLVGMIREYELVAVGIDNLRESHQLAENDSDAMSPLLRSLRQVAHETNCAIVLTHHVAKGSGEARGSTAITASADQLLEWRLTTPEGSDELAGALTIKGRYGPRQTLHARFAAAGKWSVGTVAYVPTGARDRIAAWLEDAGGWHTAKAIHEGMDEPSIKLKTVQNELATLARSETVLARGNGKRGDPREYALAGMSRLFPEQTQEQSGPESVCSQVPEPLGHGMLGTNGHAEPGADRWSA